MFAKGRGVREPIRFVLGAASNANADGKLQTKIVRQFGVPLSTTDLVMILGDTCHWHGSGRWNREEGREERWLV